MGYGIFESHIKQNIADVIQHACLKNWKDPVLILTIEDGTW
jgi:hypothetical protein